MTIPSTPRKAGPLLGNGVTTSFPFAFKVFAPTDIKVVIANSAGVETVLVLNSDYTVTLNPNQDTSPGGTVNYPISGSPLPSGSVLSIIGNIDYDQALDLPSGGNFSPLALENQLDRTTMQIQQLREEMDRTLRAPVSSNANSALPSPQSNALIGWNNAETGLQNFPLSQIATALAFANYRHQVFTGDGVTDTFPLTVDPVTIGNTDVSLDGLVLTPGVDYTLVAGNIVTTVPPGVGAELLVRYGEGLPAAGGDPGLRTDLADTTDPSNGAALVANAVARVDSIASLRALPVPSRKTVVYVEGYYTPNDGGGSAFLWVPSSTNADNGGTVIQPNSLPANGRWERSADEVPVEWFGAVGNGVADDTAAILACLTFCRVVKGLPGKIYSVSTLDLNDDDRYFSGYGATLRANSAGPIIRSLLANRSIPNKSLENVKIIGWRLDGNSLALNCLQLERFTRQCVVRDCEIRGATGDGIDLYESWSYEFSGNRVTNNGGRGGWFHATSPTDTDGNNAFCFTGNWFSLNGAEGFQVESVQAGFIAGNTSEYNGATNAIIAGRSLDVIGNYFEGFSNARTSLGGSESCVILGTADLPFLRSSFKSYVNGGSVGASSFDGDGIELFNVIESEVTGLFSQSTRYAYVFSEAWTLIGSEIGTSLDANGTLRTPAIRNITTGTTGGLEVVKGTNAFGNSARRNGATAGLRDERQIKANGVTGSIAENRILENGNIAFRYGKLSSALGIFDFDALDGYYYRFNVPSAVAAVVTTAQRDALPNKVNGMIIYNSTTGNYEGYKASSGTWATLG